MSASEPFQNFQPAVPRTAPAAPPVPPGRPPVPPAPPGFGKPPDRSPGDNWFGKLSVGWGGGDLAATRKRLLRDLVEDPFDPLAHRRLGQLLLASGESADALEELRWAVVLAPECLEYRYCLLGAYCGLRMVDAALREAATLLQEEKDPLHHALLLRWISRFHQSVNQRR